MAKIRIIDGAYILDWRDTDGKRHRDTLGKVGIFNERDAQRILKQRRLELSAGYQILNPAGAPTFGTFASDYLLWHAAEFPASHERIKQIFEDYLIPEFEHDQLDALAPKKIEMWKHKRLATGAKSATVLKEFQSIRALINKAIEWEEIRKDPIPQAKGPRILDSKPPLFFTIEELGLIYAACRQEVNNGLGPQPDPLRAAYWKLFANTGMRRTEGLILRRAWIGRDAMKILSTEEDRTKSGKWRDMPIADGAREALEAIPRDGIYVLPRIAPTALSKSAIRDIARAGIDGSMHTFRHTYISHLVMRGVPMRTVQRLAGHAKIATTEKYSHLSPTHLQDAGKGLNL